MQTIRNTLNVTDTTTTDVRELLGIYHKKIGDLIVSQKSGTDPLLLEIRDLIKNQLDSSGSINNKSLSDIQSKLESVAKNQNNVDLDSLEKQLSALNSSLKDKLKDGLKSRLKSVDTSLRNGESGYVSGATRRLAEKSSIGSFLYKKVDASREKAQAIAKLKDQISVAKSNATLVTVENQQLKEAKASNVLLSKISKNQNDAGFDSALSGFMGKGGILSAVAQFLTKSPIALAVLGAASLGAFAYSVFNNVKQEDENNNKNKEKNAKSIDERESKKSDDQRLTPAQKATAVAMATLSSNVADADGTFAGNSNSRKTLSKLKTEYINKRTPELNADPKFGNGSFNTKQIASDEFDQYVKTQGDDKNSPVNRILGSKGGSVDKVASVAPSAQSSALGTTQYNSKPITANPSGVASSVLAKQLKDVAIIGSGVDLTGMNNDVMSNLTSMAAEYFATTGKKLQINSAARSSEKQALLYKQNPNKAAPPGSSMHEHGLAFDINSADANTLSSMGLMQKYGFTRPVRGEAWHVEPASIQGNKAAIKAAGTSSAMAKNQGTASAGSPSANDSKTESEGTTSTVKTPVGSSSSQAGVSSSTNGSSSPQVSNPPPSAMSAPNMGYTDPSSSIAAVPTSPNPDSSGSQSGNTVQVSLDSIPVVVPNLDLVLINRASI